MSKLRYPHLFEPLILGDRLFRNRLFASPTGYQNMTGDNILPPGAEAYYERKAMGGAASVGMAGRFIHTNLSPECQRPLPKNCQEITCLLDLIAPREE